MTGESLCAPPAYNCATNGDDCDDGDADNFSGNTETCDQADNDCDGLNNDCVGTADEQCPTTLTVEPADAASTTYGGGGGADFDDNCPSGEVMVGIDVRAADRMDNIRMICAPITLVTHTTGAPYTYGIDRSNT